MTTFANLSEVLFWYRQHDTQTSRRHLRLMQNIATVQLNRMQELFPQLNAYDIALHRMIIGENSVYTPETVKQIERYLDKLETLNRKFSYYSGPVFAKFVRDLWLLYYFRIPGFYWQLAAAKQTSRLFHTMSTASHLKFFVKCLINWNCKRVADSGSLIEEKV